MYTLIIPAAGQGKRMGAGKNKLFLLINEVPIIVHTLRAFERDKECKSIVMAINEEERPYFEELMQKYPIENRYNLFRVEPKDKIVYITRFSMRVMLNTFLYMTERAHS